MAFSDILEDEQLTVEFTSVLWIKLPRSSRKGTKNPKDVFRKKIFAIH